MASRFVNFLLYQAGWFACILGAASGHPWAGMTVALALTGAHLALARQPWQEWRLILWAGSVGVVVDSLQIHLGVFRFPGGHVLPWLSPPWVVVLWMQFSTLFHFALSWISRRYVLAAFLGLVGGPLAFRLGESLGAVHFPAPARGYLILGFFWFAAVPLLTWIAERTSTGEGSGRYRGVN